MTQKASTEASVKVDRFEMGGENLLPELPSDNVSGEGSPKEAHRAYKAALQEIRIRLGTLFKTETVSLLLGAGASVECGGQLIGSVPIAIEKALEARGSPNLSKEEIPEWLSLFYLAVRGCGSSDSPVTKEAILKRLEELKGGSPSPLAANFERVLAQLHRWRSALPTTGGCLHIKEPLTIEATAEHLDAALQHATSALANVCVLPVAGKEAGLTSYKNLLRKLLTRPLNLKRVNIFTLNYDTLVEQAADAEGVVLLDGFVGTQRRVFRPESYELDLYFPAETTEGRVHRFDRVLHLYKLHGSITWCRTEPTIDNPYGVESGRFDPNRSDQLLIYPTPAKYGETLGLPYSELFRRFAAAVVRPQSVLFVMGYGFGDEHVNAIIRQALAIPSFTMVIVDPKPQSRFVEELREQKDHRVWITQGPRLGTFSGFVNQVLPDLHDEEIRQKVIKTYTALSKDKQPQGDAPNG